MWPFTTANKIHSMWFFVSGMPTATMLVYDETARSLTCTSTGGPATTVTWRKDGAVISLNATYQQTQVVTDPVTGTYQTVLTIAQSVPDIFGTYSCTVGNTRGTSATINPTGTCWYHRMAYIHNSSCYICGQWQIAHYWPVDHLSIIWHHQHSTQRGSYGRPQDYC